MKRMISLCLLVALCLLLVPSCFADEPTPLDISGGTYEVGDEIPVGKYSIKVISGSGYFNIFKSYDAYVSSDGNMFSALLSYFLDNDETWGIANIGILDLREGMFISNDGVKTEFTLVSEPIATDESQEDFVVYPGTYLVGTDIPNGKYSISVTSGSGYFNIFKSYDKYDSSNGNMFSALESYFLDVDDTWGTAELGNVRLSEGMYVVNNGATVVFHP